MIKFKYRKFSQGGDNHSYYAENSERAQNTKKQLSDKIEILKKKNFNKVANENEYKFMLEKCLGHYYKIKWIQNRSKLKLFALAFIGTISAFQLIKYYYIIYYYFMWEIDIRKPKVSDYIVERFR
jgi:hypothetical protein